MSGPVSTEISDRVRVQFRCRTFISVCNQPATQGQLSLPSLPGRWMRTSFGWEGKREVWYIQLADERGVQVKLRCLENVCHTWAPQRYVHDIRRHTSPRLPYLYLTLTTLFSQRGPCVHFLWPDSSNVSPDQLMITPRRRAVRWQQA